MSDEQNVTMTRKEFVEAQRAAFVAGALAYGTAAHSESRTDGDDCEACNAINREAAKLYPLPKVVRPRVVTDPFTPEAQWRVSPESGHIEYRWASRANTVGMGWMRAMDYKTCSDIVPLPERVKMWADLLLLPFEEVPAESL